MLTLGEPVLVHVARDTRGTFYKAGVVIARTIEENPRYDVRLANGEVENNLTMDFIRAIVPVTHGGKQ